MNQLPLPDIIVEFPLESGVKKVARSPDELARASAEAVDRAMDTIRSMAARTRAGIDGLVDRPDQIEVVFGIKLTAEAGAVIAKVGGEATLQVTMSWQLSPSQ